jgi:hypothetical protein
MDDLINSTKSLKRQLKDKHRVNCEGVHSLHTPEPLTVPYSFVCNPLECCGVIVTTPEIPGLILTSEIHFLQTLQAHAGTIS